MSGELWKRQLLFIRTKMTKHLVLSGCLGSRTRVSDIEYFPVLIGLKTAISYWEDYNEKK